MSRTIVVMWDNIVSISLALFVTFLFQQWVKWSDYFKRPVIKRPGIISPKLNAKVSSHGENMSRYVSFSKRKTKNFTVPHHSAFFSSVFPTYFGSQMLCLLSFTLVNQLEMTGKLLLFFFFFWYLSKLTCDETWTNCHLYFI